MKLSFLITNYNGEKYLEDLLESISINILRYEDNIEVLVIDDKSTDNSEQIVASYKFAKFIKLPENRGQSFARNFGLKKISGDYFMFLDNDDIIGSSKIIDHIAFMFENNIDILESKIQVFSTLDKLEHLKNASYNNNYHIQSEKEKFQYQAIWNKIYRKNVIPYIHFDEDRRFGEDMLVTYSLKLNREFKIYSTDDVFVLYRKMNSNSVSSALTKDKFIININDFLYLFNKYEEIPEYLYFKQYFASFIYLRDIELDQEIVDLLFTNPKLKEVYEKFNFWNSYKFGKLNVSRIEYLKLKDFKDKNEQLRIFLLSYNFNGDVENLFSSIFLTFNLKAKYIEKKNVDVLKLYKGELGFLKQMKSWY